MELCNNRQVFFTKKVWRSLVAGFLKYLIFSCCKLLKISKNIFTYIPNKFANYNN